MHETTVPGINAQHAVITDECRKLHGDIGAFHRAVFELLKEYDATTRGRDDEKGVNYHLTLTVEDTKRSGVPCRGGHMASMPEPAQAKDASDRAKRPTEVVRKPSGKGARGDGDRPGVRPTPREEGR